MTVIGIVSPGAMGSALGRAWAAGGARVVATVDGRSARTRRLAQGIELLPTLADVVAASDLVVGICPPGAARAVLDDVLDAARVTATSPVVADLNAVSPGLAEELAGRAASAGLDFVDGSISGGPPTPGGDTLLYLSGGRAQWLADLPADGLRRRVVGDDGGHCLGGQDVHRVGLQGHDAGLAPGAGDGVPPRRARPRPGRPRRRSTPTRSAGAARRLAVAASKSGRFVAEMEQIAQTQGDAGVGSAPVRRDGGGLRPSLRDAAGAAEPRGRSKRRRPPRGAAPPRLGPRPGVVSRNLRLSAETSADNRWFTRPAG